MRPSAAALWRDTAVLVAVDERFAQSGPPEPRPETGLGRFVRRRRRSDPPAPGSPATGRTGQPDQPPPPTVLDSGPVGAWRSLVAHLNGVQEAERSNRSAPTINLSANEALRTVRRAFCVDIVNDRDRSGPTTKKTQLAIGAKVPETLARLTCESPLAGGTLSLPSARREPTQRRSRPRRQPGPSRCRPRGGSASRTSWACGAVPAPQPHSPLESKYDLRPSDATDDVDPRQ
jgi:hypothetical protein